MQSEDHCLSFTGRPWLDFKGTPLNDSLFSVSCIMSRTYQTAIDQSLHFYVQCSKKAVCCEILEQIAGIHCHCILSVDPGHHRRMIVPKTSLSFVPHIILPNWPFASIAIPHNLGFFYLCIYGFCLSSWPILSRINPIWCCLRTSEMKTARCCSFIRRSSNFAADSSGWFVVGQFPSAWAVHVRCQRAVFPPFWKTINPKQHVITLVNSSPGLNPLAHTYTKRTLMHSACKV